MSQVHSCPPPPALSLPFPPRPRHYLSCASVVASWLPSRVDWNVGNICQRAWTNFFILERFGVGISSLICMPSDNWGGRGFYCCFVFHLIERSFDLYGVHGALIYDEIHTRALVGMTQTWWYWVLWGGRSIAIYLSWGKNSCHDPGGDCPYLNQVCPPPSPQHDSLHPSSLLRNCCVYCKAACSPPLPPGVKLYSWECQNWEL